MQTTTASRQPRPLLIACGLLLILAAATVVRCYQLNTTSLWLDEFFSVECSSGWARTDLHLPHDGSPAPDLISLRNARPWWTIWHSVSVDENHPPLYFILLRGWRAMFGDTPAALRSLSLIASLISIVLLFAITRDIAGPGAALSACLLMALAWPQIQRAQDARPYALLTTVSLAAALALVRIERHGITWPRLTALTLAALLAPLVHYLAFTAMAAMALYAAIALRGHRRIAILVCLAIALAIYAGLWGPSLLHQHQAMLDRTAWLSDPPGEHLRQTWVRLALVPVRFFIQPPANSGPIVCAGAVALLAPLLVLRRFRGLLLWWLWMAVPILSALVIDLHYGRASLGNTKYTTLAEPAAYLMVGMLSMSARRMGWLVPAVLALACALCLPNVYQPLPGERDWKAMAALLRKNTASGDSILLIDHSPNWPAGYFLVGVSYYLPDRQRPLLMLDEPPPSNLLAQLHSGGAGRVAIVGNGDDITHLALPPPARLVDAENFANFAVVGVVQFDGPITPRH